MSYARNGLDGSDVYVYAAVSGEGVDIYLPGDAPPKPDVWVCHECTLRGGKPLIHLEPSPAAMLAHLRAHRAAGHTVPEAALARLLAEANLQ